LDVMGKTTAGTVVLRSSPRCLQTGREILPSGDRRSMLEMIASVAMSVFKP